MKKLFKSILITFFIAVFLLIGYNFISSYQDTAIDLELASLPTKETKLGSVTTTNLVPTSVKAIALVDNAEDSNLYYKELTQAEKPAGMPDSYNRFDTFTFKKMPYRVENFRLTVAFSDKKDLIHNLTYEVTYTSSTTGQERPVTAGDDYKVNFSDDLVFDLKAKDGSDFFKTITILLKVYSDASNYEVYTIKVEHDTAASTDASLKSIKIIDNGPNTSQEDNEEDLVLSDSFTNTGTTKGTLNINNTLTYNSTGLTIEAVPKNRFASISITVTSGTTAQTTFSTTKSTTSYTDTDGSVGTIYKAVSSISYSDFTSTSDIYEAYSINIAITVTPESGGTARIYSGTITKDVPDNTQTFEIKEAVAYYLDENGQEQSKPITLSELGIENNEENVEESEARVKVYGSNEIPFSTYKIEFKIKPTSASAKVYIDALEGTIDEDGYYTFVYDNISYSLSARSIRKRLLIKTAKFQLLRPDSKTSGGGEYYLELRSEGPDKVRDLTEVAVIHITDSEKILAQLSTINPSGTDEIQNPIEIKKSQAGTPNQPGETFKLKLEWISGYTKVYVSNSKSDDHSIVNNNQYLYDKDTIWHIGETIFIYLKSQDGESTEYILQTQAADERSTENGIDNVIFMNGDAEIDFVFDEATANYIISNPLPYEVQELTAKITLKDEKETLLEGAGYLSGAPGEDHIVTVILSLVEGTNTYKLKGISEKEAGNNTGYFGTEYSFSITRETGLTGNYIESILVNNIDCIASATGLCFDYAFDKEKDSFSMYFSESTTEISFDIEVSSKASFTTSLPQEINSSSWDISVKAGTDVLAFDIIVLSQVDRFQNKQGNKYTVTIYFADTSTEITNEQLSLTFAGNSLVDKDGEPFVFDSSVNAQPAITVPYATKSISYSIKNFLGEASLTKKAARIAGEEIPLSVGTNTFDLKVYSELGKLSKNDENVDEKFEIYTLTIEREQGSQDVLLKYLAIKIADEDIKILISDVSGCTQDEYHMGEVTATATTATITATPNDEKATIVSNLENLPLSFSDSVIKQVLTVKVQAEDEDLEPKDYSIVLWTTRANPSSDTSFELKAIKNSTNKILTPNYNPGNKYNYTLQLSENSENSTVRFEVSKPKTAILVIVDPEGNETTIAALNSEEGMHNVTTNTFAIPTNSTKVIKMYLIAEDRTSTKDTPYVFTITRDPNTDATLKEFTLNGERVEGFTPTDKGGEYTIYVSNEDTNTYTLEGILNQETSSIQTNNCINATLVVGENTFTLVTLAEDETTSHTYTLHMIKDAPAELTGLEAYVLTESKDLTPGFAANTLNYDVNLLYREKSLRFVPSTYEQNTIKFVIGEEELDTFEVSDIPFGQTSTYIIRVYTASTMSADYTISVYREEPNHNATLHDLSIAGKTLEDFEPDVEPEEGQVYVYYAGDAQTVTINTILTEELTSTIISDPVVDTVLEMGDNIFTIVTLAEDGETSCSYVVRVVQDAPKILEQLEVIVDGDNLLPDFESESLEYYIEIEYEQTAVEFVYSSSYAEQGLVTLTLLTAEDTPIDSNQVTNISVDLNIYKIRVTAESGAYEDYIVQVYRDPGSDDCYIESYTYNKNLTEKESLNILEVQTEYSYSVERTTTTFNPEITVSDKAVITWPDDLSLTPGQANPKTIIVTSQNGHTREYTFMVYPADTDHRITDINLLTAEDGDTILGVDKTSFIDYENGIYTLMVPNAINEVYLEVLGGTDYSTTYLNNSAFTNGMISFNEGENELKIYIQSEYDSLNPSSDVKEEITLVITRVVDPIVTIRRTGLALGEPNIEQTILYGDALALDLSVFGHTLKNATVDGEQITFDTSNPTYQLNSVTNNITIEAEYEPINYEVTINIIGEGSVTPAPTEGKVFIPFGSTQEFNFIPSEGYSLKEILLDGFNHNADSLTLGFVDETARDHIIIVSFEIISYTISLEITGNGYIQRKDLSEPVNYNEGTHTLSIDYGTNLDLVFISDPGQELVEFKLNGVSRELTESFKEMIKSDLSIAIEYGPIIYEIEVKNSTGNGEISPNENKTYYYHDSATYTFTPEAGYHVSDIVIDGVSLSEEELSEARLNGYTFSDIEASHTFEVSFAINTYTITVIQSNNGNIKDSSGEPVLNPVVVEYGSSLAFTIEPLEGCSIVSLVIDGNVIPASTSYTFISIVADHTITAVFQGNSTTYSVYHYLQYIDSDDYEEVFIANIEALVNDEVQYLVPLISGFKATPVSPIIIQPDGQSRVNVYYQRLSYTITYAAHPGINSFLGAGTYRYGEDVVIEATFNNGYRFVGFVTNDEELLSSSTENPYSFTMPAGDIEIRVDLNRYFQVEIAPIRNGYISINPGMHEVLEGESMTITFEPNEGYVIDYIVVDSMYFYGYTETSYKFPKIQTNHSFAVQFKQLLYTVTTTMVENGMPAFEDIVELPYGSSKEITILPRTGYRLVNVTVDDNSLGTISNYTLKDIKEPHTILIEVEQLYYRIVVTSTEGGMVNPIGNAVVNYGADKFFTFIPDTGYYVKNVRLDNRTDLGQISNYIFERVTNDHSLSVEFEQYSYTITHNTPEHGKIEADGDLVVPYGTDRMMTFTPDEGYVISDVKINGISVGGLNSYTFINIQANQEVEVEFEQIFFDIEVQITGQGTMNPSESLSVPYGTDQSFVITPNEGFYISRLAIDGYVIDVVEEYVFENVVNHHNISVEFEKLAYTIDIVIEGKGSTDADNHMVVDYGTDVSIHILPDFGQRIRALELDGIEISTSNVIELSNVIQNHRIHIVFEQLQYTLTIEHIGNGSINPTASSIIVDYGENQTFSFIPERGNGIKDVLIDDSSIGSVSTYTFEDIQQNHSIKVEFEELFHTITINSTGQGTVSPSGENVYAHDSNLACRFTPDEGYYISDIIVDGVSVGNEITGYYFASITDDHTIEVQFTQIVFNITVYFGPHGKITYPTEEGPTVPNEKLIVGYGSTIDFTITSDDHYFPKIWINGEATDSVNELVFEDIQMDYILQVDFTLLVQIDITSEGDGIVPETNEYEVYTPLTLVFTPNPGNKVKEILIDGRTVGSVDNYTFPALVTNHTVHVIFEQIFYTIHSTINGEGTVVGDKNLNQLVYADTCVLIVTPEEGWQIGIVFVDGQQTEVVNNQITIKDIDGNVEVVVYFSEIPVRSIPLWIFIVLGAIILILIILLILVSIFNKKRKDRYRY